MKICEKCNIKYEDDQNFCSFCGTATKEFQKQRICSCGAMIEADAKFCNFCGKNLKEDIIEKPVEEIPVPPVKTGSWAKILIAMGVAFIVLTAVCLII